MNSNRQLNFSVWLGEMSSLIIKLPCALFLAVALGSPVANGAPQGELDTSFGKNGLVILEPEVVGSGYGRAIAQQSNDRKLLIAGDVGGHVAVLRLNTDGSLDDAFGNNGMATIDFGRSGELVFGLILQPDGKILVAGSVYLDLTTAIPDSDFALARLNPDGTLDTTFDGDGLVTLDLGGSYEFVFDIALLPNGQIVVTGTTDRYGDADFAFARFRADGALDTTFGTGSVAGTTLVDVNALGDEAYGITTQLDGKIIACGLSDTDYWDHPGTMTAVRLYPDGSIDTEFGTNGVVQVEAYGAATSCIALPDGKILLGGTAYRGTSGVIVARLSADGTTDSTFGDSGVSKVDLGGFESVQAMILLDDSRLGVTGRVGTVRGNISGSPTDMFIGRVDPDTAVLDPTFGNKGVTIIDFGLAGQTAYSESSQIVQQADGNLVVVGTTRRAEASLLAVARLDTSGSGNAGTAGWTYTSSTVPEGSEVLDVSVRRTGGGSGTLSVDYNTVAGSATSPNDYSATFGTLVWADGDMDPKSVAVVITSDNVAESDEDFTISLSNSTGGLAASEFHVTITEIAKPSPGPPGNVSADRGGGTINIGLLTFLVALATSVYRRRSVRDRNLHAHVPLDTVAAKL